MANCKRDFTRGINGLCNGCFSFLVFFTKYRPQFYFRTTDVTGEVELPSGTEMVMPGDDAKFKVKLITPIAMSEKLNFAIREGGRTVGAGVVTKIIK